MERWIKAFLDKMPYVRELRQQVEKQGGFPAGHYYSPIPDKDEVLAYIESRKSRQADLVDIRLNKESQFRLLFDCCVLAFPAQM